MIRLAGANGNADRFVYTVLTQPTKGALKGVGPNLTYTPLPNETGPDLFMFQVSDDKLGSSTATVSIDINAVNDPPTMSAIEDQKAFRNQSTAAIRFQVNDVETPADSLVVAGRSDNESLVPASGFKFDGNGPDRTVVITPAQDQIGTATITLSVSDSENEIARQNDL